MKTKNRNTGLLIAFIFTIIHIAMLLFVTISLMFDLFGIVETYGNIIRRLYGADFDVYTYINYNYFSLFVSIFINFSSGVWYLRGYRAKVYNKPFGVRIILSSILQLLCSGYIPGIVALVSGIIMYNKEARIDPATVENQMREEAIHKFVSDYKLLAMKEAIERLKELRASGAISEEEYYANLNKILEG